MEVHFTLAFQRRKMKILIIDDSELNCKFLDIFLKKMGHTCIISNDGKKGVDLIMQENFDRIMLDLAMADFSGYDVLDRLDVLGILEDNKIIINTAVVLSKEKEDALKRRKGIHACIMKGIDLKTLSDVVLLE